MGQPSLLSDAGHPRAPVHRLVLADEASTDALGAGLAGALPRAAEGPLVLALEGELGAGKTTLARALLRALGARGAIKSPSYALLEPYDLPPWQVLHVDLYRLLDPADLEQLGVRDALLPGHLLLVEWPARGGGHLPPADLWLRLSEPMPGAAVSGESVPPGRVATIEARSAAGQRWLAAWLAAEGAAWQDPHKTMGPTR